MDEPVFAEVINAMWNLDYRRSTWDKRWAQHHKLGYQIDGNKLWRIGDSKSTRACTRLECITQNEAKEMPCLEHKRNGPFSRDLIKISLLDQICSPKLDKSIISTIIKCG